MYITLSTFYVIRLSFQTILLHIWVHLCLQKVGYYLILIGLKQTHQGNFTVFHKIVSKSGNVLKVLVQNVDL